jgi:Predicted hydrolase (metallo-beta-lactamase superfamily)
MKTTKVVLLFALLLISTVAKAQIRAHYINVGQADSILVEFRTAAILIDAGGESTAAPNQNRDGTHLVDYLNKFFANRAAASNPQLPDLHRTLLAVIISHPHIDHTKNIMAVMQNFTVQSLFDGGNESGSGIGPLNEARKFATQHGIPHTIVKDDIITRKGLSPFPQLMASSAVDLRILDGSRGCDNQNNDSLIVLVRSGQASFMFTGDAEVEGGSDCDGEVPLLMDFYPRRLLDVDVYKVGHHASFNGTNDDFMRVMTPKIAVISAGIHTQHGPGGFHAFQFGHPRTVTVDLLDQFTTTFRAKPANVYSMPAVRKVVPRTMSKAVYCTCWDGDIRVSSNANGSVLKVQTSGRPDGNGPIN